MTDIRILVQAATFDAGAEIDALRLQSTSHGAIATFIGVMRDHNEGDTVTAMTLEHYPGMTEKALQAIADAAASRWQLGGISIIHRVGTLQPADPIVFVGVTAVHRAAAFQACEYLMDYLKTRAPLWKKEATADGERWVDARASDGEAEQRWASE